MALGRGSGALRGTRRTGRLRAQVHDRGRGRWPRRATRRSRLEDRRDRRGRAQRRTPRDPAHGPRRARSARGSFAGPPRFAPLSAPRSTNGPPARTFAAPALVQFDGERLFTITEHGRRPPTTRTRSRSCSPRARRRSSRRFGGDLHGRPDDLGRPRPALSRPPARHPELAHRGGRSGQSTCRTRSSRSTCAPTAHAIAVIAVGTPLRHRAAAPSRASWPSRTPARAFAGDHVVFARANELHVLDPGGRIRAFGVRTASPGPVHDRRHARAVHGQRLPAARAGHGRAWRPTSAPARARGRSSSSTRSTSVARARAHAARAPLHVRRRPPALPRRSCGSSSARAR